MKGYSLALDFKVNDKILNMLDKLDKIVSDYDGRVYLTKDARLSKKNISKIHTQK